MAAAALSVLTTLLIVGSLLFETIEFFGEVPVGDFLFGTKWTPQFAASQQSFGVLPLVWGTIYLSLIALVVAIPLGLLSAIYLSEYAPPRVRKIDQAGARDAGRRPDDRLRLLRADVLHAGDPARAARPRRRRLQRPRRGPHHGPAGAADDRLGGRGRDVGRARTRCARARSASAPPSSRSRCGSSSRPRSRASSRRSCSAPRAPSARPCSCSSPAARRPTSASTRRESFQTMAAFIAAHGARRHPDRLDRVPDDLRGRLHAVRPDPAAEHRSRSGSSASTGRCTNDRRTDRGRRADAGQRDPAALGRRRPPGARASSC